MNAIKVILATALLSAPFLPAHADEIKLAGSITSVTTVFSPIKEAYESNTGDTFTITITPEAEKALISLVKGEVDMASVNGLSFDDLIDRAKALGVIIDPASLKRSVIGTSNLLVLLNKANKVKQLSKEQLKAIFTGKVTNWRDVGGVDGPITVYWGKGSPNQNKPFTAWVLDGERVTAQAKPAGDLFSLREIVVNDPTAIVLSTSGLITPSTKVPEIPVMKLPMEVVTKGEPSAKVKRLLKYHKEEFGYMDE
jgi:phosphate transport system substrate-binding protein